MDSKSVLYVFIYWMSCVNCLMTNVSRLHQELPPIRDGEPCEKGKMYKMSCNSCHCAENNALFCTKMACLEDEDIPQMKAILRVRHSSRSQKSEGKAKKSTKEESYLPILPNGLCVPGRIYRQGCRKCFCDDTGRPACSLSSTIGCEEFPKPTDVLTPTDVIPRIPNEVFRKLPTLPHSAAACKSGKMYMVTCNACLCLDNGNLLCERLLCLDQEEMNYSKAKKWTGTSCKAEDTSLSTRCVRCECLKNITHCRPVPGCAEAKLQKLHGNSKTRLSLDVKKDKCEPGAVYKVDCNYCYCQPNRSLRCTQKTCLNYRQALMLKKQRSYLEKHGL